MGATGDRGPFAAPLAWAISLLARRPGWITVQRWLMGTVLGVLAVRLATETRR